jgi:hypothetical protein
MRPREHERLVYLGIVVRSDEHCSAILKHIYHCAFAHTIVLMISYNEILKVQTNQLQ